MRRKCASFSPDALSLSFQSFFKAAVCVIQLSVSNLSMDDMSKWIVVHSWMGVFGDSQSELIATVSLLFL